MKSQKMTVFTIGYCDNKMTGYLLNTFVQHEIHIDGAIFIKNKFKRDWKRLLHKMKRRGWIPSLKRIIENLFLRKKEISNLYQKGIDQVYFVDEVNSEEVRDILLTNGVDLLILTSTPIIKKIILDIEGLTIFNAHTGWLPKYRGLDANLKAMRDGQPPGVSVHKVTKKIDGGEVYLREQFSIDINKSILRQMDEKELELSGKLLIEAVHRMRDKKLKAIALSKSLGKYEPALTRHERRRIIQQLQNNHQRWDSVCFI